MRPVNTKAMWIMAGLLLLCSISGGSAQSMSDKGPHARLLLQKGDSTVVITEENVKDFTKLVEGAKKGTDIVIAVPSIRLSKPLEIKAPITLRGQDPENRPKIDCKGAEAWITVSSTDVVLEDFILSQCKGPALRITNEAFADPFVDPDELQGVPFQTTHILHVDFYDNRDEETGFNADGGAIGISGGSNVTVVGCLFRNNFGQLGGGIHVQSYALLLIEQSDFIENEAMISGAAISSTVFHTELDGPSTSFVVVDCNFIKNKDLDGVADSSGLQLQHVGSSLETSEFLHFDAPQASGGAIYVAGFKTVLIDGCTFDANSAVPAGGALFVADNKDVQLKNNKFYSNYVHSSTKEDRRSDLELGGGVYISFVSQKSSINIESCTFENNTASYGGGLHIVTPLTTQPTITNCVFERNAAHIGGGGIVIRNTIQAVVQNMLVKNNTAAAGGGLLLTNGAGVSFVQGYDRGTDSKFLDNRAYDGGAWFFLGPGQVMSQAIVMARNHAVRNGGAAYLVESLASGGVVFQDSEIIDNSAARGGGIFMSSIVNLDIRHSFSSINTFKRNKAGAGGALYLMPSSQIDNNIKISDSVFEDNEALVKYGRLQKDLLPIFDDEMGDETTRGRRLLENLLNKKGGLGSPNPGTSVLREKGDDPCLPGGGGAICLVLNQIPERARVNIHVMRASFKANSAHTGGAMFIATTPGSNWVQHCSMSSAALSTTPCRGLGIQNSEFKENIARGGGGALFMTDSSTVHFDTKGVDGPPRSLVAFSTLRKGNFGKIANNAVGHRGYGSDVATGATRMQITTFTGDGNLSVITEHHISGTKLPVIRLAVVDTYDQVVSAGVSDSVLKVQAISEHIAGQLVSVAENGIVTFDALTFTADPGDYSLKFLADGLPPVESSVTIRSCMIGEFNVTDQKICTNCSTGFYGLDPMAPCQQCNEHAECSGGPVLVPKDGHWHSTPYSPQIHSCLSSEACSYDNRLEILSAFYADRNSLEPGDVLLTNSEYPQCSEGYEGVLCGSCSQGYGHFEGGECMRCKSKRLTSLFVFLVAFWSLALLGFTIRSALSSIRDFNDMRTILARKAQSRMAHSQPVLPAKPHPITSVTPNGGNVFYNQDGVSAGNPVKEIQSYKSGAASSEMKSDQSNASIDHIIAAENLSETLKIAVNFLQVTSVAIAINADWSEAIENTLAIQDLLAGFSNGASLIALDCLLKYEGSIPVSIRALVLRLAFPIVLLIIVVAIFLFYWIYLYCKRKEPIAYFRSRTIISSLVVLFFAYEFITQELMRIMNCVGIDVDQNEGSGQSYWRYSIAKGTYWGEDTSLKCYEGSHARLVGSLGGPGLIIFSFGIPLFVLIFLLWNKHNNKLNDQTFLNTYGFIFQNYNEQFVYWEVLIMFRKALVDGIVVFAYPLGPNLQGVLALGVLIVSLVLHLVALPYKYKVLNLLEGASLVASIFMFYSGIVFNDKNTSEVARVFLSALLIAINLGLVVMFVIHGFQQVDKFLVAQLKCYQVPVPRGFFPRAYKFCLITVSRAAVEVQEQGKNHPLVKGMSHSIKRIQSKSAQLGKSVSRRVGKLGTTASGRSLASTRSARSIESQNSQRSAGTGIGGVSRKGTGLGGIPEISG